MSIADSIIKGTYGNNNTVGIKYSSKKTSIADSIINGSYYETLKKRKKEKEEEQKRIAEQQKLEKEQQVKKQIENVSTYGPTTQTNKVQTVTDKLKNIAPVSNETIKSNSQIGETQKVTRSDVKAQEKAKKINTDLKNGNKASAIGAILNGIPEGIKSGVAKSINALNILGARTFDEQDKKINWMQDEILKDKPNATANRLKDMPSFANRAKNKLLDKAEDLDDRTAMHSKTVSQIENSKVKTAAGVSSSIGEMIPAMISNIIAPGSGIYASAVQNAGGSAMETLNSDRNNIDKAVRTGVLKGTASALTEKITGGNLIAKGGLDNAIGRAIKGNVKSKIGQNLLYKGYQILGEMGEEQLENEAGYVIDKVINNKDMPDLKQRWEEATETAKMTGLTTIALNLVGLGGGSIDDVELSDMSTKDKKTIKDILERAKKTGIFKEGELADLVSKTDVDNKIAPIKDLDYLESAKKNNIDTNNETVRSIARITNERGIKASYDSNVFTNTNQNALWRIKTDENGNVTREVIINPNADTNKTLQNIAIHELTHDIEGTEQYNQIKDIILKYDKTKNGFEEARKSLAETYSKMYDKNSADFNELVDNEAVADILGNKLGDQDFINNLTMQNRTLGQKIYDWVVDKLNKLNGKLGYKSEKIYWADVKNKFENAFKQEYQNTNNQTSRFSIQTTADGNKKTFYDVTKIKRISQNRSTSANAFSTSLTNSNNSIAPIKDDVNTTKYSMQESENNTQLSERAEKELHRYAHMNKEELNKAFSDAVENKENMLKEYNRLSKEYKDFQKSEEFINVLKNEDYDSEIWSKAGKYADKLRYYNENYEKYKAQQDAINSLLMEKKADTRSSKQIVKEAEKHFGITDNFKETAYIDINGNQIDFSGKHEGGMSGSRSLDHRQINEIDIDMQSFINMGNIRIIPEGNGINLSMEPNEKQYKTLSKYIDNVNGDIYIDIDKTNTTYDSAIYKAGTSTSKIINDIQYYFENGKFPKQSELAQFRYSQNNKTWQEYLNKNYKNTGRGEAIKDIKLAPIAKNNVAPSAGNYVLEHKQKKTMNPTEISNLKLDDASTTPKLEQKNYKTGNKQSSFLSNIITDSKFLNEDLRQEMAKEDNIRYYSGITNAETLEKAYNSLKEGGEKETLNWFSKNEKNISAEDVTKGWILLKQYQDAGDYQGAVEVAKKMRQMGTSAGQAVQAYNIMARMSPEGMFYYAQSELNEAFNKMIEGKSKQWIEKNQDKFTLTPEETQTIIDTMKEVGEMEDGREKTVKLAEIQKLVSDKIPPSAGQSIKAWMRISMLFNPKTQVRNVMGNSVVLPVNATADVFSGAMDKLISKKTGVRTTGVTKEGIKGYAKGFGKGLFESYDDFRKGINTRNVEGDRFEIGEGKSFKDKGLGKALNRVDSLLSFSLDAGDRGFYEASFTNSINNQLVLNNTTEVTQDMIDIATQEALQRTWQDDNSYTQTVLSIRKNLNKLNVKGYGLGDVLIPFAKTPANLTKAIVDYSPVGLVKTLALDARKFNNSLSNGQYSPQLQHKFVQNLGKGMAGSLLYVLGYGLAKAGIATGESDDDKDVKNFMKNSLGIGSYSIKVGDKSFSYDWAQPVATPLAIMTNYVKYSKDNPDASAINKAIKSLDIGTEQLLQQSFMESLNTVLNGTGTTMENLSKAILDLPARSIPTFSKQIADMVDETQRTTFEYGKPVQSAINSVISKIPFASKSLPASVNTLGHEVKKYGGNNNLWNVMLNPANTNKGQLSKVGEEIYNVYMQTGDTTIFPRTAPYYINSKGEKVNMTTQERNKFQTVTGKYVEDSLNSLMKDSDYKKLSNDKKAAIINEIVSDSYSKAKYDVLKIDSKEYEKKRNTLKDVKPSSYYNYKFKTEDMKKDNEKINVLVNANYTDKEKTALYENYILSSTNTTYPLLKKSGIDIDEYMKYLQQDFKSEKKDNGTTSGKTVAGSAKRKTYEYVNSMNISYEQKLLLLGTQYKLNNEERTKLYNYVKTLDYSQEEMQKVFEKLQGFTVYKDGRVTW